MGHLQWTVGIAFQALHESCEPELFSMDRLLVRLARSDKTDTDTLRRILPTIETCMLVMQNNVIMLNKTGMIAPQEKKPCQCILVFCIFTKVNDVLSFHCINTSYLPDDSYSPAPAGPAKRKKKTSRVSPPAGPAHYNPLTRWPSSCLTRQRDVTS